MEKLGILWYSSFGKRMKAEISRSLFTVFICHFKNENSEVVLEIFRTIIVLIIVVLRAFNATISMSVAVRMQIMKI